MQTFSPAKTIFQFLALMIAVVVLSTVSARLWGGKSEKLPPPTNLNISQEMTVKDFGEANGLPNPALKEIFALQQKSDLEKKILEFGTPEQIQAQVTKKNALSAEHESKNWQKIFIKFATWFSFFIFVFLMFRNKKITTASRKIVLLTSVLIFGVILSADPSPMGTVKDAIFLFATAGAIFPPRMVALVIFLLIVFLANKYICSWGCQAGVLQDLIYRFNQDDKNKSVIGRQIKIPFVVTNGLRIAFLVVFTIAAFSWGTDIIEYVDPFKIFKPVHLGIAGGLFVGLLFVLSLFMYRPWCHLFCPFGLVGWLVEKISWIKISVDYDSCIACKKCEQACPSTVMSAILRQDGKTIPDCFSCYACREACPTNSIEFSTRKRTLPPAGHFEKKG